MENVLIAGAGGFGREVLAWCRAVPGFGQTWRVAGFLDDATPKVDPGLPIVGKIVDYQPKQDESLLLAIGAPGIKRKIVALLSARGAKFRNLVHPTAIIGDNVQLGEGAVVCPYAVITVNACIGSFVTINVSSSVGHDARIGNYSTLSGHCDLTGFASIGEEVFLGSHAVITPSRKVGDGAVIGAGAVVFTNVPAAVTMVGNPARILRGT